MLPVAQARSIAGVVASVSLLLACSSGPAKNTRAEGGIAGVRSSAAGGASGTAPGAGGATSPPAQPGGQPGAGAQPPEVAAARAALDTYLDALAANDFTRALSVSGDAVGSLTVVRSIIHTSNAARGGSTTSTFEERAFDPAGSSADTVRFSGRAALASTVSGPAGPPAAKTDTFSDMVVRRDGSAWRVTAATYNGQPLVSYPASSSSTVGPVQVTLAGSLAFGNSLGVIVQLVASGDHRVGVSDARLRTSGAEAASSSAFVVPGQPGFVFSTFPRRDERPSQWNATITVDGVAQGVTLGF